MATRPSNGERARPKRASTKRRRARDATSEATRVATDGDVRPAFARRYPADPQLDALVAAFAAGNFAYVRSEAPRVADEAGAEDVRLAALDVRRRIEPPPTAKFLWGVAMALLAFLFAFYASHAH